MKQKLALLILALFTTIGGAWAQETTVVTYGKGNGTFYDVNNNVNTDGFSARKFVSSTTPAVTIIASGGGQLNSNDAAENSRLGLNNGENRFTISVPQDYVIVSYSLECKAVQTGHPTRTLTTESGQSLSVPTGDNSSWYSVSETDINKQSTYFTVTTTGWSPIHTRNFRITVKELFYKITFKLYDENSNLIDTQEGYYHSGDNVQTPTIVGYELAEGEPTSITVAQEDAVYELHYVSSSFDYTLVVNGAVEGMTMTIKGDAITSGQTAYSSAAEVAAEDVVVTFPSEYSYMTAKVTISGTTITVNCEDTRWPVNFDKSQTFTRSDRHINSASFNDQIVDGLYVNTSTTCYQDLTATKTVKFPPSTSVKPSFAMTGAWQHGFVYIDLNNDGDFTDEGELVSKINEGNPDLSTAIPAFISPATAGTYRMRFKTDWSSEDPGGNEGAEPGNVNGNNHIIKNGGMIVDITLEISEDYSDILTAITKPFTDYPAATGYFRMTSDNATSFLGMVSTASTNDGVIDADEYAALLEYFKGFVRFPDTGYYLIKNSSSNNYLAYGIPGESGKAVGLITTEGNPTPANIIRLTKVGFNEYTISSQGLNVQARKGANNTFPMSDADGVVFSFVPQNASNLKITNTDSYVDNYSPGSLFEAAHWTKPYAVVNWEPSGAQGQWTIEAAEDVTISLTAANDNTNAAHTYATLCVPFEIIGLTGADSKEVKAYAPTKVDNAIVPGAGASTIAAGTPVILIGEEGATSVTATIGSGYAATPATTNILTGTFAGTSIDCTAATGTNYVLGFDMNNDNRIGFYHVDNASFNLKANRAYLHSEGSGVKGFVIDFDDNATGIETMVNGQSSMVNEIYNLAGQRLQKAQKGINIINGKKILK